MGLAFDGQNLWTFEKKGNLLIAFSPKDGVISKSFPFDANYGIGISYSKNEDLLYLLDIRERRFYKVDPRTGVAKNKIDLNIDLPSGIQVDDEIVWIGDTSNKGSIYKISNIDMSLLDIFPAPGSNPFGLACDTNCLWISNNNAISSNHPSSINCMDKLTGTINFSFQFPEGKKGINGLEKVDGYLYLVSNSTDKIFKIKVKN